jgi:hypothetical protein
MYDNIEFKDFKATSKLRSFSFDSKFHVYGEHVGCVL